MSKKKKILLAGGVLVVLVAIILIVYGTRKHKVVVQTGKVDRKEVLESVVSASGEIRAREFVDLQSEIAGVITDLNVKEGDRVKKGDVLLKIDPVQTSAETKAVEAQVAAFLAEVRNQETQIASAESNRQRDEFMLRSARAELEQSKAHLEKINNSFERAERLSEQKLVSREAYDTALADLRAGRSQLEAAQAKTGKSMSESHTRDRFMTFYFLHESGWRTRGR